MKIGIYDPYLDTLGGGERYVLSMASYLSEKNEVQVFWDDPSILANAQKKTQLDLTKVTVTTNIFNKTTSLFTKRKVTSNYDCIVYISDGSIPFLFAKKNILLLQFPVNWVRRGLSSTIKLKKIHTIICYSEFVKTYLDKSFGRDSLVIVPPVEQLGKKSVEKENVILHVGRFTKGMNTKKQDFLIQTFIDNYKSQFKNWKLVLIGSVLPQDQDFVDDLREKAEGYPIEIIQDASFQTVALHFRKAKIYWHATGFGEDLKKNPERAEHFGISTVEAMSAGTVPIVINAGGQREIVEDGKNGLLWNTEQELIEKTVLVIQDSKQLTQLSDAALIRAREYSPERFYEKIETLLLR